MLTPIVRISTLTLFCTAVAAQKPVFLADINKTSMPQSSHPNPGHADVRAPHPDPGARFTVAGDQSFVVADDGSGTGRELYVVNHRTGKSTLVKDIFPLGGDSQPAELAWIGKRLWFSAATFTEGRELWVSDATPQGTYMVKDLRPGRPSSSPRNFTAVGSRTIFTIGEAKTGVSLYVSDGTSAGTTLLKTFEADGRFGSPGPFVTDASGSRVYFSAFSRQHGRELWVTDGSSAGTKLTDDLDPGAPSSFPTAPRVIASSLYFAAGKTVYRKDSRGTQLVFTAPEVVRGIVPLASSSFLIHAAEAIWLSDGTNAGTRKIVDVSADRAAREISSVWPASSSRFYYFVAGHNHANHTIWFNDGTSAGSTAVHNPGNISYVLGAVTIGDTLFFHSKGDLTAPSLHKDLWLTQPTAKSARKLASLPGFDITEPRHLTALPSGQLLFAGNDVALGEELFYATAAGMKLAFDIRPPATTNLGSNPSSFARVGNQVLFAADDGVHGRELWSLDPKTNRVSMVVDFVPGSAGSLPRELFVIGDRVFFCALVKMPNAQVETYELCVSDGSARGTKVFMDLTPGNSVAHSFTRIQNRVYFSGGSALFVTDGSVAGTKKISDLGSEDSDPREFTPFGPTGDFLFVTLSTRRGSLWRSDGTSAGTRKLTTASNSLDIVRGLTRIGDKIYFAAEFPGKGRQLGVTDGTVQGTKLFFQVSPGLYRVFAQVMPYRGGALFPVELGSRAAELWWTDGTLANTRALPNLGMLPFDWMPLGSRYFGVSGIQHGLGNEYWISDGTSAGTRILETLPGPESGGAGNFAKIDGAWYFSAIDDKHGAELWKVSFGASSLPIGHGCTTRAIAPRLSVDDAVLGKPVKFHVERALPNTIMLLQVGNPGARVSPLIANCAAEVDYLAPMLLLPEFLTGASWSTTMTVPNDFALNAATLATQSLFFRPDLTGFETSNGVTITIGNQ